MTCALHFFFFFLLQACCQVNPIRKRVLSTINITQAKTMFHANILTCKLDVGRNDQDKSLGHDKTLSQTSDANFFFVIIEV